MGDVGEGTAVDEGGGALQGLDQIGLQRILQKRGHSALSLEVVGGDGLAVISVGHHHAAQTGLQIGDIRSQAQHGHDLAGDGDVEAVLPGHALHPAAKAVHHVAQLPVVHIHAALPGDLLDVDAQGVALLDVVVQHGGAEVVGRADGVEIAGEMEVDVLHGHHLGVTAAGRAALDAEHGAEGGLPQGDQGVFAKAAHGVCQTDGGGGLSLTGGSGIDGGDQHQLAVAALALPQQAVVHLGLVVTVQLQILLRHTGGLGDLGDGLHGAGLGDLDIGQELHSGLHDRSCCKSHERYYFCLYERIYHRSVKKGRGERKEVWVYFHDSIISVAYRWRQALRGNADRKRRRASALRRKGAPLGGRVRPGDLVGRDRRRWELGR